MERRKKASTFTESKKKKKEVRKKNNVYIKCISRKMNMSRLETAVCVVKYHLMLVLYAFNMVCFVETRTFFEKKTSTHGQMYFIKTFKYGASSL